MSLETVLKPWRRLKSAVRAKIEERVLSSFYSWHQRYHQKLITTNISSKVSIAQLEGLDTIPLDPTEDDIWNRLQVLPWDSTWHAVLLICVFLTTTIYLPLLAAFSLMTNEMQLVTPIVYTGEIVYTVDLVLYIIAICNPFLFKPTVNCVNRPVWIVAVDAMSVLPLQLFTGNTTLYNKLCLVHCLKAVRIHYVLRYIENMLAYSNYILWCEIVFWLGAVVSFGSLLAVGIQCRVEDRRPDDLFIVICNVVHHITNGGYYQVPNDITWTYIKLIVGLPFLFLTMFLAIATRAYHVYRDCYKKKLFTYQHEVTKQILDKLSSSPIVSRMYNSCYETIWRMCGGYSGYLAETLLPYSPNDRKRHFPPVMWMDIMEDITANFFYHSILFTDVERSFLRALAVEIRCLVYSKGQLLYVKDELADKMVYIVSGMVQVLSSEDEETSVLDMISGTCLGETCLLLPKVAVSTIRCAQDCEIQVLKSKSYFRVCKNYGKQHRVLRKVISDRIKEGRDYKRTADLARGNQQYYMLDMMWINHMLHKLAGAASRVQSRRHELQNIYLRSFYTEDQMINIPRMIEYLRLINIAARTISIENSIMLKTTWPYIIHPDGILRQLVEIIMIMASLAAALGIPYMCFIWESIYGVEIVQFLITSIWVTDLWVQTHTAIINEQGMITSPIQILRYRLTTVDFIIDIFSCLPLELLIVLFAAVKHYRKLQINRAAKLWRVHRMFQRWENGHLSNTTLIRVTKLLCFLVYAIYVSACVMCGVPCKHCRDWCLYELIPVATQLCTGISLETQANDEYVAFYFPMMICSWFVVSVCVAYMIVCFLMTKVFEYKAKHKVHSFQIQIPKHRKDLQKNLRHYIETQELHGQCMTIIYNQEFLDNLTRQQMRIISELHIGPTLRKCPLFAELGDDNILEVCSLTQWRIKAAGDVILNCGDVSSNLIILLEGVCEIVNGQTGKSSGLRSGCILSGLEVLLDEPICQTVVTVTHCRIIMFDVVKLRRMFELFPKCQGLQPTISACQDIKKTLHDFPKHDIPLSHFKYYDKNTTQKSFYNINENKRRRLFYMRHFAYLNFFSFIRFFLMTRTIIPDGKFMYLWEVFRSVCAVLSTVTYIHVKYVCIRPGRPEYYILWFLDVACYADIYVRLHAGFFNKHGLLIQHPLLTARNYLYGSFIIDFFTAIPFRFITILNDKPDHLMIFHMFKILQLYRYFRLVSIKAKSIWAKIVFLVIPTCVLTVNFTANCSILIMCSISHCGNWPRNLRCIQFSPVSQMLIENSDVYLYGAYVVTSIMTTIGLQGVHYLQQYVFFWSLNVTSLFLYSLFTGVIVSISLSYDRIFLKHKHWIVNLRNFMNVEKVPISLQSTVLDYYQCCWDIRKGQDINYVMRPYSFSLQRDILYELFGKHIQEKWILQSDDSIFFLKRILLHMPQLLVLPGHDVLELNDVCPLLYIIVKGAVIVRDGDKTIVAQLKEGSMFGNLTDANAVKLDTSFGAVGVLEMLHVPSTKLFKILKSFPQTHNEFKQYKRDVTGLNYIASSSALGDGDKTQQVGILGSRSCSQCLASLLYLGLFSCVICTLVHTSMFFYQVTMRYKSLYFICIMYLLDGTYGFMFLFLHLLRKHALFKVNYGWLERRSRYVTAFFFITLLPLELTVKREFHTHSGFFGYISLKGLTLLRLVHIYYIHKSYLLRFSQHMVLIRMSALIALYVLMMLFCTAVLSLTHQLAQPALSVQLDALGGNEKLQLYVRFVGLISNLVLKLTNIENQPMTYIQAILMIVMMVTIRLAVVMGTAELYWIVSDMNVPHMVLNNKLLNLFNFMNRWGCSQQLMDRVQNYLEIDWLQARGETMPALFKHAPTFLKRSIAAHCYLTYVKNHSVFGRCPHDFQRQLVLHFKLEMHAHGQRILLQGTHNKTMYWVHRGLVLQMGEEDDFILRKGDCFEYQEGVRYVNTAPSTASYKALTQVHLVSLERPSWIHLLDYFPESRAIVVQSCEGSTTDIIETV